MRIPISVFGRTAKGLLYSELSNRAKVLWAILDEQSQVRTTLSRAQLVDLLHCSMRSLDRAVEELEAAGWLTVGRVRFDDGTNRPNDFTLAVVGREIGPAPPAEMPGRRVKRPSPVATGATTPRPSPVATGATRGSRTGGNLSTSRTTTEKESYDFGGGTHVSSAADSTAPPTCSKHPHGPNHEHPCLGCKRWRLWTEQQPDPGELDRQRRAQAIIQARIACHRCDHNGIVERDDGLLARCTHDAAADLAIANSTANGSAGGPRNPGTDFLRAHARARAAAAS